MRQPRLRTLGIRLARVIGLTAFLIGLPTSGEDIVPSIDSQTVMLYYTSLDQPAAFYGETLGLTATMDTDWVKIYQVSETSSLGVVAEGEGAYHKARSENAVMLSIVTREVDAWYQRLQASGDVKFLKEIYNSESVPIRAFLVEDPGGYTVEFFQWLSEEETP